MAKLPTTDEGRPDTANGNRRYHVTVLVLVAVLAVLIFISLSIGQYSMDPRDMLSAVWNTLTGQEGSTDMVTIVFSVRLPRMLAALMVGSALSLSGALYQSVFRNPLVSSDLLGVSTGACVGAAIAILLNWGVMAQQSCAFICGLVAVGISIVIPRLVGNTSNMMLVLSGIITSGFMGSILGIIKFVADPDSQLSAIVYWQMGSLATASASDVWQMLPLYLLCSVAMIALSWRLNILSFGEAEARTLGMNVKFMRGLVILCASLPTASTVCTSGTIGWIGLVIPHLARLLVGSDNRRVVPITLLLGGVFLLVMDTLARTLISSEIPLSILTGLIGAPFYAWLLYHQRTVSAS